MLIKYSNPSVSLSLQLPYIIFVLLFFIFIVLKSLVSKCQWIKKGESFMPSGSSLLSTVKAHNGFPYQNV